MSEFGCIILGPHLACAWLYKVYWNSATPISLHTVELSSNHRGCMARKVENTYYLNFHRKKSVLTPDLHNLFQECSHYRVFLMMNKHWSVWRSGLPEHSWHALIRTLIPIGVGRRPKRFLEIKDVTKAGTVWRESQSSNTVDKGQPRRNLTSVFNIRAIRRETMMPLTLRIRLDLTACAFK